MAEEYELGTVGPIPTVNPNVAKIGEMLKIAKKYADQYYVKDYVPLIGGMTLGDFLLGKAPEEVERWGQGDYPFRNPATVVGTGGNRLDVFKTGRFEPVFDVIANVALPAAGTAQMVSRPLARSLGPKAAEMTEDYLTKQGAIANIVEPSPKKIVEPFSQIDELGFHSPLENAILKIQQPKGTGEQFLKQLEKTPGVKTEELDVTGIKQYLLNKPTITKQELLDEMATSRLKLEQKVLSKGSDDTVDNYQLRGGDVFDDDDYIRGLADDLHYDMKNDDVIRAQEREALLKADPERYEGYPNAPYMKARLEEDIDEVLYENAKQQAEVMYYDDPIRKYYDDYGYEIYGNENMGYSVKDPRGQFVDIGTNNYSIDDVQTTLVSRLFDEGVLDYEGAGGAKYEDYTLPGKYENYREVLVTLPQKEPNYSSRITFKNDEEVDDFLTDMSMEGYENMDYGRLNNSTTVEFKGSIPSNIEELIRRNNGSITVGREQAGKTYQSSHFDEPNILAHTRLDDRIINGKKTLFVEEIQSDWHQAGRKKGYASEAKPLKEEYKNKLEDWRNYLKEKAAKHGGKPENFDKVSEETLDRYATQDLYSKLDQAGIDRMNELFNAKNQAWQNYKAKLNTNVPDAPYKKNWHELMMKQVFNEAIKGNYDAVAFTTGRQQAERYNLSKQIDSIDLIPALEGDKQYVMQAWKNGNNVIRKAVNEDELPDLIGKEAAKKLMEQNPTSLHRPEGIAHGNPNIFEGRELKGLDLDVGGEPMKKFYDEIIPNFVNKYGKKYGIGVKKANLESSGTKDTLAAEVYGKGETYNNLPSEQKRKIDAMYVAQGNEVHFIELSNMAKKDIKEKGQPLFSGIGLAPAPLLMNDEDN